MKCPCKGCDRPHKKLYCHSHCDEYAEWVKQEQKRKDEEKKDKTFTTSEDAKRTIWRAMRWKRN